MRTGAVAIELGGLGMQQQSERIVSRQTFGDIGMTPRGVAIALPDRQQTMGDGLTPARLTLFMAATAHSLRRAPQTRRSDQANTTATIVRPSTSTNTGTDGEARQTPQDITTSPG
jgi:hypothetical protein